MSIFNEIIKIEPDIDNISGLTVDTKAIYLTQLLKEERNSILYVTSTLYEANQMYQSLLNYTNDILLFPMDDFLTSEALAISPEFKNTRLETLIALGNKSKKIVVTNLMGYLRYLPSRDLFLKKYLMIEKNKEYKMTSIVNHLYELGYRKETLVTNTGEFAVRGFVIDVFPIKENNAIRIEFWGDEIDSIRYFNTETQRTIEPIDEITICPVSEFLINEEIDENRKYQKYLKEYIEVKNINDYVKNDITVFDNISQIRENYQLLLDEIVDYNIHSNLDKNTKYMNSYDQIPKSRIINLNLFDNLGNNSKDYLSQPFTFVAKVPEEINKALNKMIKEKNTIIICLKNIYQINKLIDNLENNNIIITNEDEIFFNKINLVIKNISESFFVGKYIFLSENAIFNKKEKALKYKSNFKVGNKIRDINKLNQGDYIVHSIHGIGKYIGLKTLCKNGINKDYLTVEYRGGDKLYIPVEKIDTITKYSSNDSIVPRINKLGSTEWSKTKLRVRKKLEDIAGKLLELYAKRESTLGYAFDKDTEEQAIFDGMFEYQETADQLKVISEIKKDMEDSKPMDRLLCGDVGYGKTEVAFRAAFKAIMSGKQVAYLCPTTILSNQHFKSALDRFSEFPVRIELLNRFVSSKKVKEIIERLKQGKIDFIIGTHRLLSNDIEFYDLGLLIIDEEQRFGVKHKEKIKEYKNNIDILTLSATPIPRTLQMSMTGIRNLSLLETAPMDRFPVQTYVLEENNAIIKDAIYKELAREGQVFILYNYVEDMEVKKQEIQHFAPDARIAFAHGKMSKQELENIMNDFINHEYDVLLCTTIIETGIDIPNANTLIIIDADRYGLSQLYQIRGRVGRSNKIAYCYLTYKPGKTLTDVANKRLNVIKEFTELGSGFSIAMRDLSIRGAGDILGSEQAGFIDSVGIELYLSMLKEEVSKLQGKEVVKEEKQEEVPLIDVETSIDDKYVSDTDLKIEIHQKINTIDSYERLNEIKLELEDRFGTLSENLIIYMYEEWFEKSARELQITNIRQTKNFIEITIPPNITQKINGEQLFMNVIDLSRMFRFSMRGKQLIITLDIVKLDKHFIYYLIDLIKILKESF